MMKQPLLKRSISLICLTTLLFSFGCSKPELTDREFLETLMKDTWTCLDDMIDKTTGLPRDTQKPGGDTNTTNIGLYLASLCAAKNIGLIDSEFGYKRAERILSSLETYERVRGFMPNFITVDLSNKTSHGVMAVSDFNKLMVGMIMTRQTWPELADRIDAFLKAIEWNRFYNPETGALAWGYDLDNDKPIGGGNLWLTADTRSAVFMMVATEGAPPEVWDRMDRQHKETSAGRICRGYGMGGLFLHAMDGLFLPEIDTEVGESAGNFAWHQIMMAKEKGHPLWGWSNCYIPESGYTEGGFIPERVVTPNAIAIVTEYYPKHVTATLREMVRRGGTIPPKGYEGKKWGLRDAYDMDNDVWDHRYLSLDQGMIFLGLANYLHDGIVRKIYTSNPTVQHGLKLLEPHIKHDPALLQRWKERDDTPTEFAALPQKETVREVTKIPLNNPIPIGPTELFETKTEEDGIRFVINNKGKGDELISLFNFPAVDLSGFESLEVDLDVLKSSGSPVGYLRLHLEDKFNQKTYAHIQLDPKVKTYTISATNMNGIFLDETSVKSILFSFWKSPWYFTNSNIKVESCEIKVNEVRVITSK